MVEAKTAAFWILIGIVMIPVLAAGTAAIPVAAVLVAVLLIARFVFREWLDLKKSREFGKASGMRPTDLADRSDLDERVDQDMTGDDGDGGRRGRWRR